MVVTLDAQNFAKEVLDGKGPVLVDFWAPWCGSCQVMGPIIDELAEEFSALGVKIGKMNVDDAPALASEYGIMSIPTLIVFHDGVAVEQMVGMQTKEHVAAKLSRLMNKLNK
jgi:thioredoxin 1